MMFKDESNWPLVIESNQWLPGMRVGFDFKRAVKNLLVVMEMVYILTGVCIQESKLIEPHM